VLRVNLGSYPDIIDPQKSSFVNEIGHLQMIYEGLTKLDGALETVPGAAEKWEYNADATELTFTLRPDLKYSDGSLLNAKRYEYSILRNINPETAGEYAQITDDIAGAADWRSADPAAEGYDAEALKAGVKVQALDAAGNPCDYEQADCLTLKIGLRQPAPYFHTVMSLWVTYPAKEELISEGGDNWWNSSKYQIGNGPFVLESLEPFVRGYFTPNPNYW
jgi:oligopeptide transport system substrate-binding protein